MRSRVGCKYQLANEAAPGDHLRTRTATQRFSELYKRVGACFLLPSAAVQLTPVPLSCLDDFRPGAVVILSFLRQLSVIMFSKILLVSLALGVLSVNALKFTRERAECKFPQ